MKTYEQHEIGKEVPEMLEEDYIALKENIKNSGFNKQFPIIVFEDKILDGWNRYLICRELSIEPVFVEYGNGHPYSFVVTANTHRNSTPGQKAIFALTMEEKVKNENRQKRTYIHTIIPPEGISKTNTPSVVKVAKALRISKNSIQTVKKLKKELPEIFEKVKAGKCDIKQANNALYKKKEAEKKSTVDIEIEPNEYLKELHNCDIADSLIENNSLNAIICDPPYPRGFLSCWTKLARFASEKLKDGGILLALSGQSYLPEIYTNMKIDGLNYYWTCCIKNTVSPDLWTVRTKTQWKPLLWYVKGEYKGTYQGTDVFEPQYKDTVEGQEHHKWGQSLPLFEELIEKFTDAGSIVCDPFMGGGTTAIACINKKRKFVGIEIDKEAFKIAKQRIHDNFKL